MNLRNKLEELIASFRAGTNVKIANNGRPTNQVVIRHGEFFLMVDFDVETGEPTGDFGWSRSPMTHVPVREFFRTRRETK